MLDTDRDFMRKEQVLLRAQLLICPQDLPAKPVC